MLSPRSFIDSESAPPALAPTAPSNLCDLFLSDLASLIDTSQTMERTLRSLQSACQSSPDLLDAMDTFDATITCGEAALRQSIMEAGVPTPSIGESSTTPSAFIPSFFSQLSLSSSSDILAAEVAVSLCLLAQHIELKIRLTAEEAMLIGQENICRTLVAWAAQCRACCRGLRATITRVRASAFVADLAPSSVCYS